MYKKYILLSLIAILACSCKQSNTEEKSMPEQEDAMISISQSQFEASGFNLGKVETHHFAKTLPLKGTITLPETAISVVSGQFSGTVSSMNLTKDAYVSKGQRLFILTNPAFITLQEEYLVTKQQIGYSQEELNRQEALAKENLTMKSTLSKAKADLQNTIIRNASLQKQLEVIGINIQNLSSSNLSSSISVRAPQSGYISEIYTNNGAMLDGNQTAVKIVNPAQSYLELRLLERDVPYVKKGQDVTFKIGINQEQIFKAKVNSIGKLINEDHMALLKCSIAEDAKSQLLPGMYIDAQLTTSTMNAKALPKDAVVKLGDSHFVALLKSKANDHYTFEAIKVEVGAADEEKIEIISDIDSTQTYLTKGTYYIIQ